MGMTTRRTAATNIDEYIAGFPNQEGPSAGFFESMNRRDFGLIQRGEHARLSLQEGQPLAVVRDRLGQEFDRDAAPQLQIRGLINLTHTP